MNNPKQKPSPPKVCPLFYPFTIKLIINPNKNPEKFLKNSACGAYLSSFLSNYRCNFMILLD